MTEINHVIPQLAEAPSFGSPQADIFNRLLQERIVVLGTDVNDGIANYITAQLLYLEGQDAEKPIWLYINSPGGSVTAGMAIYDTMQFVQPRSAPSVWDSAPRWVSSCCVPAHRASAMRCRTPGS